MEESLSEDLEAQLYAQVYHDANVEESNTFCETSMSNMNKQSSKRYWQKPKNYTQRPTNAFFQKQGEVTTPQEVASNFSLTEVTESSEITPITQFVPYKSVLSFMNNSQDDSKDGAEIDTIKKPTNYEKKKNKTTQFPKKFLNPLNVKARFSQVKATMQENFQVKKEKANFVRRKNKGKVVETIELVDSDESDCLPVDDLPPPTLILLDSSDEEEIGKLKRAHSPSSSSIISDDFIATGEKSRITTAFKQNEILKASKLKGIMHQKERLEKVRTFTKIPSSTSSSARSSCERTMVTPPEKSKKVSQNTPKNDEDSIYGAKMGKLKTQVKSQPIDTSDDDEIPCVNATNQKRRRKSTGSGKKSTDQESDKEEDTKCKTSSMHAAVVRVKKRSRLITPRYNDDEFASMISTIVNNGAIIEEESEVEKESSVEKEAVKEQEENNDCEVMLVQDEDDDEKISKSNQENNILSDSDDSMKNVSLPVDCDLSLNVTNTPFTPHEYIRDANESTESNAAISVASSNPEIGWNDEMKYFYDGSWGGEHFSLMDLLGSMSRNQNDWKISNADRMRAFDSNSRIRCRNCNEFGHIAVRCTRQKKRVVCFMCGEEGHRETRCPNSICLRCGKPNKMFATVCASCNKLNKRHCPLCSYQGHDIDNCPDKWRRYHSTTTETSELVSNYSINPRQFCSICARKGHFAEGCNQFLKTISGLITSSPIRIISHKPSYPKNITNFQDNSRNNQQNLALFSFFPFYKFDFQFNSRAQIYKRFMEHFDKFKSLQLSNSEDVDVTQKKVKKRKRRSTKPERLAIEEAPSTQVPIEEDSNYSFSDFFEHTPAKITTSVQNNSPPQVNQDHVGVNNNSHKSLLKNPFASHNTPSNLPEFIAFGNYENLEPVEEPIIKEPDKEIITTANDITTAKMMLTKDHFSLLSSEKGREFLQNLQVQHEIVASFNWDSTGNSMSIRGIALSQSNFHTDMRDYLYKIEREKYEKLMEITSQLPKSKCNLVKHLKDNLQSLNKLNIVTAKKMLESMLNAEQSRDHKKALKCRKSLNIAFVGYAKLCDGAQHLGVLRKILFSLEDDLVQGNLEVSNEVREEIRKHMRPIFGIVDHGDYRKLFNQYKSIKQKEKLAPNPIAMNLK